jgi:hypothetical protein
MMAFEGEEMEIAVATVLCVMAACAVWMFFDYIEARKTIGRVNDLERRIKFLEDNDRATHHSVQALWDEKHGISMRERFRMDREWREKGLPEWEAGEGDRRP